MDFKEVQAKGLARCLVAEGVDPGKLHVHLSELEPGTSAHPPHAHQGTEAFYVLEGSGTIDVEGGRHSLGPNHAIVIDAARQHGLANTGSTRMRYLVITTQ